MRSRILWSAIAAASAIATPIPARAECAQCSCSVETSGLSFGAYEPTRSSASSVADVRINCEGDSGYVMKLSAGNSGTVLARSLRSGASTIVYNLYKDPSHSVIWGDGSAGQSGVAGSGSGIYNIYGMIPAGQAPTPGLYSDSLILTIEY